MTTSFRCGTKERFARLRFDAAERDRGFIAVWVAMLLPVFLVFTSFAVDFGSWNLSAARVQNATDAAALGGATQLPDDHDGAKAVAREIANQYGFDASQVDVQPGTAPNQLRVTISDTVASSFAHVVGITSNTIVRSALAEFQAPVQLGNPGNSLGNDPEDTTNVDPQFWLAFAGPGTPKKNGDRYGSHGCGYGEYACDASDTTNAEFAENGYFFNVTVNNGGGSALRIQLYDAVFHPGRCDELVSPDEATELFDLTDGADYDPDLPEDWFADAAVRYKGKESSGTPTEWCPGDGTSDTPQTRLSVIVRQPDLTPWTHVDNPVVTASSCQPKNIDGIVDGTDVMDLLRPSATHDQWRVRDDQHLTFSETFRRWANVCEIPASQVRTGSYILQIRTNGGTDPLVADTANGAGGVNRMALRAGRAVGKNDVDGTNVVVSADQRLPIFANADNARTTFPIARVVPTGAKRTLVIELFDMGDAQSAGTLSILQPEENGGNTRFAECTFTRVKATTQTVNPPGTSGCSISGVTKVHYNGNLIRAEVTIPKNYSCTECWVRVRAEFASRVYDTTTWSARIKGNPVRLVQ